MARGRKPKAEKVEELPEVVEAPVEELTEVEVTPEVLPEVLKEETPEEPAAPEVEDAPVPEVSSDEVTVFIQGIGHRTGKKVLIHKREHVEIKEATGTFLVHKSPIGDHYEV